MNSLNFKGKIHVFADGSSKGNPGPGGWGTVICDPSGKVCELGGFENLTTNNKMELKATIEGLKWSLSNKYNHLLVLTDSKYVLDGIESWVYQWEKSGWRTSTGKPVANQDLWQELLTFVRLCKSYTDIVWQYVPGHQGVVGNERVDFIAQSFASQRPCELFSGKFSDYTFSNILNLAPSSPVKSHKVSSLSKPVYLSYVDGVLLRHPDWKTCELNVKGRKGAKYKKIVSKEEEEETLKKWGL